ncbi:hypothetical protein PFISCL1PPCAC_19106, partial [Pristionchus fissidentatus]
IRSFACFSLLLTLGFCDFAEIILEETKFVTEYQDVSSVTSVVDVAAKVIDDLLYDYPKLFKKEAQMIFGLKREMTLFLLSKKDYQLQILAGVPSEFKYLSRLLEDLLAQMQKDIALFKKEDQDKLVGIMDEYIFYEVRNRALFRVIERNTQSYSKRNLSEAEIKHEIEEKRRKLTQKWNAVFEKPLDSMIEEWKMTGIYDGWMEGEMEDVKQDL